jgi:RNA polymerase sigma factor (sigma-70 family)
VDGTDWRNGPVDRIDSAAERRRPGDGWREPNATWSDGRLISDCLNGDERAWAALIAKYRNLIHSIPMKYGATPEDAADIFQSVCLELFAELPRLRNSEALRSWLISVTAHLSFHWKKRTRRRGESELTEVEQERLEAVEPIPPEMIEQIEREQLVREALAELPPRCQQLIRLLFYEQPPLAYRELASRLGVSRSSIGFIRGRCLKRLQRTLERRGFK